MTFRVPTPDVFVVDLTVRLEKSVDYCLIRKKSQIILFLVNFRHRTIKLKKP